MKIEHLPRKPTDVKPSEAGTGALLVDKESGRLIVSSKIEGGCWRLTYLDDGACIQRIASCDVDAMAVVASGKYEISN